MNVFQFSRKIILGASLALFASPQSGCVLRDDFLRTSDVYPCEDNGDCSEPNYECDPTSKTCKSALIDAFCEDSDGDGYGSGEDRSECEYAEEDFDDTDPMLNPGASDLCDGKDNDGDGEVDEPFDCAMGGDLDCYKNLPIPREDTLFSCIAGRCVLLPTRSNEDCEGVTLACVNGAFNDTEAIAKGCLSARE